MKILKPGKMPEIPIVVLPVQWWVGKHICCSECGQEAEVEEEDTVYPEPTAVNLLQNFLGYISNSGLNHADTAYIGCSYCGSAIQLFKKEKSIEQ